MNIKQMEYFICLCEEKSFSKAAAQLNIAQPTLTQAIQKIEMTLGTPLFDRSISPIHLTEAGRIFLETSREITAINRISNARIEEIRQGVNESVRLGLAPYRARSLLPLCVAQFRRLHPNVKLIVRELISDTLLEKMENGELDLAITVKQDHLDASFKCVPLCDENVLIAVSAEIVNANERLANAVKIDGIPTVDLSAFENIDFILLGEGQLLSRYFDSFLAKTIVTPKNMIRCTEIETSLALANSGVGAALVMSTTLQYYRERYPNLHYFAVNTPMPKRTLYILSRKKQYLTEAEKTLIRLLGDVTNDSRN